MVDGQNRTSDGLEHRWPSLTMIFGRHDRVRTHGIGGLVFCLQHARFGWVRVMIGPLYVTLVHWTKLSVATPKALPGQARL